MDESSCVHAADPAQARADYDRLQKRKRNDRKDSTAQSDARSRMDPPADVWKLD